MWESILLSSLSALLLVLALDVPFLRIGINLADEGYLYFGTKQVLKGKVPIIDFRSYDPGRYYWCALWLGIFGKSLWIQRLSMSFLKCVDLAIVGFLCFQISESLLIVILVQLGCLGWFSISYKMIEYLFIALQLLTFWMTLELGNEASFGSIAFLLSFSIFLGLNLTVYQSFAVLLFFTISPIPISSIPWTGVLLGLVTGALPILIMIVRYPSFLKHYWNKKISPILKRRGTNLKVPYPWLWRNPPHILATSPLRAFCVKLLFTLVPVLFLTCLAFHWIGLFDSRTNQALILPALVVGIPWLNHVISRSDLNHMHLIGLPFGLLLINLTVMYFSSIVTLIVVIGWVILSIWLLKPGFTTLFLPHNLKRQKLEGRNYRITRSQRSTIDGILDLVTKRGDKTTFFAPTLCMLYALTDTEPGAYDTFPVYPATNSKQQEMILELSASQPTLMVINNIELDSNPERCFSSTHPLVWNYIREKYKLLEVDKLPDTCYAFRL